MNIVEVAFAIFSAVIGGLMLYIVKEMFSVVKSQGKVAADMTKMIFECQQGEAKRVDDRITQRLVSGTDRADVADRRADAEEAALVAIDARLTTAETAIQAARTEWQVAMARIGRSGGGGG